MTEPNDPHHAAPCADEHAVTPTGRSGHAPGAARAPRADPPEDPPAGPISRDLLDAYRSTDYVVDAPDGPIVLRVDACNASLAALMSGLHAVTAALVTACNPWSRPTDPATNGAAQRALEAELAARGIRMLPAAGRDPRGAWPPEPGVLAFDLSRDAAHALALRFGQNAFLWIASPDACCRLAFTRPIGDDASDVPDRGRDPR